MPVSKSVGARIKRREDPRLIQGLATYVDDLQMPGLCYVTFVRSPHAHARIQSIDASAATDLDGVVAVITGDDVKDVGGVPCAATDFPNVQIPHHPVLASGKVRFVGEPVAAIVATDRYTAHDAVDLVDVDYDPLVAVASGEAALANDAVKIHDSDTNLAFTWDLEGGDVEGALKSADRVVKQRFVHQRLAPNPLEPRG